MQVGDLLDQRAGDSGTHRLPFSSRLLEDALDFPPSPLANELTSTELAAWISSEPVKLRLQQWKASIIDHPRLRAKLQPCMSTDYQHVWDTIDKLVQMCFKVERSAAPSEKDVFEATAWFAASIVRDGDCVGSPLQGMRAMGHAHWCHIVTIRLLVVAFCDLVGNKKAAEDGPDADGYTSNKVGAERFFQKLLGGPVALPIKDEDLLSGMARIDNTPTPNNGPMDGPFGYSSLVVDYGSAVGLGRVLR